MEQLQQAPVKQVNEFLDWLHNEGKDGKAITAYKGTVGQFLKWYEGTYGHSNLGVAKPIDIKEYKKLRK